MAKALAMETVAFGTSGLRVSRMGLGLAALGRPGYMTLGHGEDLGGDTRVAAMEERTHAVLDAAWQQGVRYFDTARSYGRGEAFLASWLAQRVTAAQAPQALAQQRALADIVVGSKWGYTYTADWQVQADAHEIKEHSLAVLQRQVQESRQLLGEFLHVYHIHSATLETGVLSNSTVLAALAELKTQGVVIGLTVTGVSQSETIERALAVRVDGEPLFGSVQATWNLLEPSAGAALTAAAAQGLGVIVKEPLANGRLAGRDVRPEFAASRERLRREAQALLTGSVQEDEGGAAAAVAGMDVLALAAVLAQPWAHVVLSGAATVEQVHSNVRAVTELSAGALASVDWAGLEAVVRESPEAYWGHRSRLAWG